MKYIVLLNVHTWKGKVMKKTTSFRLSGNCLKLLKELSNEMCIPKTSVIEIAVQELNKKQTTLKVELLKSKVEIQSIEDKIL